MNFLSSEARHHGPFYYYFPVLAGGFFPWCCFLPLALFRRFRKESDPTDAVLFLALWFGVVFVFFSTASSKLDTYILPLFPAVACLVGLVWNHMLRNPTSTIRKGFFFSFLFLLAFFLTSLRKQGLF